MRELRLNLSRHCIETEIKRQYNRALSAYFKNGADKPRLEQTIALAQHALERLDFNFLRSRYAPLAGHSEAQVALIQQGDRLTVLIDGRPIALAEKDASK